MNAVIDRVKPAWILSVCLGAWLAAGLGGCTLPQPQGEDQGALRYETCAACHGEDGAGNQEFGAPAIAGMPLWYLTRQLENYRDGRRGVDPDDANGLRMRAMVRTMNHEGDLAAVAQYVASMPAPAPNDAFVEEPGADNAEAGREAFRTCVQCHGGGAEGNIQRNAPPLTGLNDWYIVAQLHLFKDGDRGTTPGDDIGATMRPMALGVADEQAMRDLAAHIRSLRGGQP